MKATRHVLIYLKDMINYSIVYDNTSNVEIHVYIKAIHHDDYLSILDFVNADHAADKNDRKSQTGYVFLINKWSCDLRVS